MTLFAFALNALLALLLLAAMMVGLRLEKRLKGLRDSHAGFAQAAMDLNGAIARAEGGLAEMRAALRGAEATLTERVDEARAAAKKLEAALQRAHALPAYRTEAPVAPEPEMTEEDLPIRELLAKLRRSMPAEDRGEAQVTALRERSEPLASPRSRARVDDDLFEEGGLRRAGAGR